MDLSCKFSLDKKGRLWGEQNASYANSEMSIKDKIFRGTLLLLVRTKNIFLPHPNMTRVVLLMSACEMANWCGQDCQNMDKKLHKEGCKLLRPKRTVIRLRVDEVTSSERTSFEHA